ncbi:GroES-like protein [Meredithblackwellia eburnea MCA 4105]
MKAVLVSKEGRELKEYPIPTPGQGEVLIRNIAVSSNPKDWKIPYYMAGYSAVEGNDVAGYIETLGEGVTGFKPGDKVAAFTKMRSGDKYGAYSEFSVAPEGTTFHLGPKSSFEDAAALPLAYGTAAIGLFKRLGLPTPDEPSTASPPIPILIWGASSTVGVYAVQLAKKAGLYVVGIAGAGGEHAKAYGADEIIDYRGKSNEQLTDEIALAAGGRIKHAYDAISENGTVQAIAYAFEKNGGGSITYVLTLSDAEVAALPKTVVPIRTLVATAYGADAEFSTKWYKKVGEWLEEGAFKSQQAVVIPGGLEGVKEGLRRLQAGEVRSEKFVYKIADTPGL